VFPTHRARSASQSLHSYCGAKGWASSCKKKNSCAKQGAPFAYWLCSFEAVITHLRVNAKNRSGKVRFLAKSSFFLLSSSSLAYLRLIRKNMTLDSFSILSVDVGVKEHTFFNHEFSTKMVSIFLYFLQMFRSCVPFMLTTEAFPPSISVFSIPNHWIVPCAVIGYSVSG